MEFKRIKNREIRILKAILARAWLDSIGSTLEKCPRRSRKIQEEAIIWLGLKERNTQIVEEDTKYIVDVFFECGIDYDNFKRKYYKVEEVIINGVLQDKKLLQKFEVKRSISLNMVIEKVIGDWL